MVWSYTRLSSGLSLRVDCWLSSHDVFSGGVVEMGLFFANSVSWKIGSKNQVDLC